MLLAKIDRNYWTDIMSQCPCGSNLNYSDCCGLYITAQAIPQTPEALMRSRYTAYSMANIAYIKKTMIGKPLVGFNEEKAEIWAKEIHWIGLKIVQSYIDDSNEHSGFVEFIATYLDEQTLKTLHEISQFELINGHWFYMDGQQPKSSQPNRKISRNAPCPCGSKKKLKNCHVSIQ